MGDKISSPDMPDVWVEVEFCHDLPYEIDGEMADENLDRPVLSIGFPVTVDGRGYNSGRDTRSIILTRDGAHKLIDELNSVLRNERCIKSHGPKED